jgi:hypothetical protein
MEKFCDLAKIRLKNLLYLNVSCTPEYKELISGMLLPVYMCIHPFLVPEWLDGLYLCSVYETLCIVG